MIKKKHRVALSVISFLKNKFCNIFISMKHVNNFSVLAINVCTYSSFAVKKFNLPNDCKYNSPPLYVIIDFEPPQSGFEP